MLTAIYSSQFRKDFKLCQKRGCNMQNIAAVMFALEKEGTLQAKHREHLLQGDYRGYLECHIEPDWLIIYQIDQEEKEIYFSRTGTHSDLF